LATKSAR